MVNRVICFILATIFCLGLSLVVDIEAYSSGICSGAGPGRIQYHMQVGGRRSRQHDDFVALLLLSSTSTTIYCMTLADEEENWRSSRYQQKRRFSALNYESLQEESAKGRGEYLTALAYFFGCTDSSISQFSAAIQADYNQLFPTSPNPDIETFMLKLDDMIQQNVTLKKECKYKI